MVNPSLPLYSKKSYEHNYSTNVLVKSKNKRLDLDQNHYFLFEFENFMDLRRVEKNKYTIVGNETQSINRKNYIANGL